MLQPVADYSTERPKNWDTAFSTGAQLAHAHRMLPAQQKLEAFQKKAELRKAQRLDEYNTKVDALYAKEGHNPWDMVKLNKDYGDVISGGAMSEGMDAPMSPREKELFVKGARPIYHAAMTGNYEIASQKAMEMSKALENVDPEDAQLYLEFSQHVMSDDPKVRAMAMDNAQAMLMEAMGIDDFTKMLESSGIQAESGAKELALEEKKIKKANKKEFDFLALLRKNLNPNDQYNVGVADDMIKARIAHLEKRGGNEGELERLKQIQATVGSENVADVESVIGTMMSGLDQEAYTQMIANEATDAQSAKFREEVGLMARELGIREDKAKADLIRAKAEEKKLLQEAKNGPHYKNEQVQKLQARQLEKREITRGMYTKIGSLAKNLKDENGNPIDFGGTPQAIKEGVMKYITGQSEYGSPDRDMIKMIGQEIALANAMLYKMGGSTSELEFLEYMKVAPKFDGAGASSDEVVQAWMENAYAAMDIMADTSKLRTKFSTRYGLGEATEDGEINIGGEVYQYKKGDLEDDVIQRIIDRKQKNLEIIKSDPSMREQIEAEEALQSLTREQREEYNRLYAEKYGQAPQDNTLGVDIAR